MRNFQCGTTLKYIIVIIKQVHECWLSEYQCFNAIVMVPYVFNKVIFYKWLEGKADGRKYGRNDEQRMQGREGEKINYSMQMQKQRQKMGQTDEPTQKNGQTNNKQRDRQPDSCANKYKGMDIDQVYVQCNYVSSFIGLLGGKGVGIGTCMGRSLAMYIFVHVCAHVIHMSLKWRRRLLFLF